MNKILDDFNNVIGNLNKVEKYLKSRECDRITVIRLDLIRIRAERLWGDYTSIMRAIDDFNDQASEDLGHVWSDITDISSDSEEVDD